ncbi:ATP-dependent Clp protease adapter ClpS [Thorsellia anophelis]|uniref:ATP-dependent Clp protease adapter protein ClpS n=1 Tax=Thorsellia anophelis DSM 18579 TaxID=1123402 RepID=A0A1I0BKE7_9GAMM|nr:ATP-dependent Clp protease adapter ClpS [Thorsellia anophelis]SET06724.1 ATP-dependent Clp protease adaptor protein ClpS [Thorsellia anophelis DSM 18579]
MNDLIKKFIPDFDDNLLVLEKETPNATPAPPEKYRVLLLNDDFTPMDFVVDVLTHFFHHSEDIAYDIMMKVHLEGSAICGVYTAEIAESKVAQVTEYARSHEHPLMCKLEKDES